MSKEAMKLALEALKQIDEAMPFPVAKLAQAVLREALAEQPAQQEPVAWMSKDADIVYTSIQVDGCFQHDHIPLYTAPPQRTWVGLTDEERMDVLLALNWDKQLTHMDTAKAIEAKLKEKNT